MKILSGFYGYWLNTVFAGKIEVFQTEGVSLAIGLAT